MDIASLIAIVGGIGVIFLGVLTSGGSIGGIIDIPSIFVTVGGSFFSTAMAGVTAIDSSITAAMNSEPNRF